jgi:hypothetical protein
MTKEWGLIVVIEKPPRRENHPDRSNVREQQKKEPDAKRELPILTEDVIYINNKN